MTDLRLYFSDFFEVDEDIVESYGAVNISLINDLQPGDILAGTTTVIVVL